MYKKKPLNFAGDALQRNNRVINTLKARETSRFKRFSVSRNINDSDSKSLMETPKQDVKVPPENKAAWERKMMLEKWKQEKKIKKDIDKQVKKRPFYVGGNTNIFPKQLSEDFKSSVEKSNITFNTSKLVKSKFTTPAAVVQSSKIQNKQGASNSIQSLRVPNSKQKTPIAVVRPLKVQNSKQGVSSSTQVSKIPSTKQGAPAFQSSKIPNYKQVNVQKSGSSTAAIRKFQAPTSTIDKVNVQKSGSSASAIRKFQAPTSTIDKVNAQKYGSGAAVRKFQTPTSTIDKSGKGLAKPSTNVTAVSKGISVQSKMPVSSSLKNKIEWNLKLPQKEVSQSKNSSRIGYSFKSFAKSSNQQIGVSQTPQQMTPRKLKGKTAKDEKEKLPTKKLEEQTFDNLPDMTFNSDISIINPANADSFAPTNFSFRPPVELAPFEFDDDLYKGLEALGSKFNSRTSTPTKESERKSNYKNSSVECNKSVAEKKMSDVSNSNDIGISEFMTPDSFKVKPALKETFVVENEQVYNEKNWDTITDIKFKEVNIAANQQVNEKVLFDSPIKTEVKSIDIATTEIKTHTDRSQRTNEELNTISPTKTEVKDVDCVVNNHASVKLVSGSNAELEAYIDTNQQAHEELVSFSPTKTGVKVEDNIITEVDFQINTNEPRYENLVSVSPTKIQVKDAIKNINSQACEEMTFNSSENEKKVISVNDEVITDENKCNYFFANIASKNAREKSAFLNINDEDFLDFIDLNKIDLVKSDDDDSGEDDVLLEISKFSEGKTYGAIPKKRVSMLKKLSVMNSISETVEASNNSPKSLKGNLNLKNTPRRSKRISDRCSADMSNDLNLENCNSPNGALTPRRSLRLMKITSSNDRNAMSPLKSKETNQGKLRRSIRLIDFGTPEKAACKEKFKDDCENLDTNNLLLDLESPSKFPLPKSKKISLLYSPEKRKSIRKSIRGDLMAFSPL